MPAPQTPGSLWAQQSCHPGSRSHTGDLHSPETHMWMQKPSFKRERGGISDEHLPEGFSSPFGTQQNTQTEGKDSSGGWWDPGCEPWEQGMLQTSSSTPAAPAVVLLAAEQKQFFAPKERPTSARGPSKMFYPSSIPPAKVPICTHHPP